MNIKDISVLNGLKIQSVIGMEKDSEEIIFKTTCGKTFKMYHSQDCCESVYVEDVCGIAGLANATVIDAYESTNEGDTNYGSYTWTFYTINTDRGSVTIRWYGESNGYYSEDVFFVETY